MALTLHEQVTTPTFCTPPFFKSSSKVKKNIFIVSLSRKNKNEEAKSVKLEYTVVTQVVISLTRLQH